MWLGITSTPIIWVRLMMLLLHHPPHIVSWFERKGMPLHHPCTASSSSTPPPPPSRPWMVVVLGPTMLMMVRRRPTRMPHRQIVVVHPVVRPRGRGSQMRRLSHCRRRAKPSRRRTESACSCSCCCCCCSSWSRQMRPFSVCAVFPDWRSSTEHRPPSSSLSWPIGSPHRPAQAHNRRT